MIDWNATEEKFGTTQDLNGNRPKIVVVCDMCGTTGSKTIRRKSDVINNQIPWQCNKCIANRPEKIAASRKGAKKAWKDQDYIKKIKSNSRKIWENTELASKMANVRNDPETKRRMIEANIKAWSDPELLERHSNIMRQKWADKDYRRKHDHITCSSIQQTLYSILDDLNVKHYREYEDGTIDNECQIGPYTFDCVIPVDNGPDLIIECQGDYWHRLPHRKRTDSSKAAYISNNFTSRYELKYLWEHEFYSRLRVQNKIKEWLGIQQPKLIDYVIGDVRIAKCDAAAARSLLSKYHYLPNAGRGGISYGAYLDDKLIAVCVFSPLIRQNIRLPEYIDRQQARELSRLCIHPNYQKKNLASWFMSRCIKALDSKYKYIISYCDTTFGHDGTVYKAANFRLDGGVKPDYWYVSKDGWVMHKRTLYGHAKKLRMKEREYAEAMGYSKVWGKKKLRFIYERG